MYANLISSELIPHNLKLEYFWYGLFNKWRCRDVSDDGTKKMVLNGRKDFSKINKNTRAIIYEWPLGQMGSRRDRSFDWQGRRLHLHQQRRRLRGQRSQDDGSSVRGEWRCEAKRPWDETSPHQRRQIWWCKVKWRGSAQRPTRYNFLSVEP